MTTTTPMDLLLRKESITEPLREGSLAPACGAPVSDVDPFSPHTSMMHGSPKAKSSLVRRLVAARNDPAKRRICAWLAECDDERLSGLGVTSDDIAILRGTRSGQAMSDHRTGRRVTDRRPAQRDGA